MTGLFVERTDWPYYERLKAATPDNEWTRVVDAIVDRLDSRWEADTIVEIHLREEYSNRPAFLDELEKAGI